MGSIGTGPITETRIAHIMGLMRAWQWKRGVTGRTLAKEWGVSEDYVSVLAAAASKRVFAEVTDPSLVSGTVGTALSKVLHDAMDDGDRKSVIESSKAWAQIAGSIVNRHEVATVDASPAKARELMRQTFGAVTPSGDDGDGTDDAGEGAAK